MNDLVTFCSVETVWSVAGAAYTTSPSSCKAMYTTLLLAKSTGARISNMYFDGDSVPLDCTSWLVWQSASVRFLAID
jgi:hypothetical protein